jgi:hypothetical protein
VRERAGRRSTRAADRERSAARTCASAAFKSERSLTACFSASSSVSRRRCERHVIDEVVPIVGRKASHSRQVDFLFDKIILERRQALLFGQHLDSATVHVYLRDQTDATLLRCLLVQRIGGFQLSAGRIHSGCGRDHLEIRAADCQDH